MASLFDKEERSPLLVLIYTVFLISLMALNDNEKIKAIPYLYIVFRVIYIIFSIYIIVNGIRLIKGTFKEQQKRRPLEILQIVFIVFLLILVLFVTVEHIILGAAYINKVFKLI